MRKKLIFLAPAFVLTFLFFSAVGATAFQCKTGPFRSAVLEMKSWTVAVLRQRATRGRNKGRLARISFITGNWADYKASS